MLLLYYLYYLLPTCNYRSLISRKCPLIQVQPYSIAEKEIEDTESHKNDELYEFSNVSSHDYNLSRKTVNAGENFWNVYCFATNQMRDKTAEDNRQTAALISHDLIQNNELAFSSTTDFQFYRFQILRLLFLCFSLFICKE